MMSVWCLVLPSTSSRGALVKALSPLEVQLLPVHGNISSFTPFLP